MNKLCGIRLGRGGRVHYFDPVNLDLGVGDRVLVGSDDGPREGQVVIAPDQVIHSDLRGRLDPLLGRKD